MKKYKLKNILYLFLFGLTVVSCNEENKSTIDYNFTGNISLTSPKSLTVFDKNEEITVTYKPTSVKPGTTLKEVEILRIVTENNASGKSVTTRPSVGKAKVENNKATFNSSIFDPYFKKGLTGDVKFEIVATLSDNTKVSRDESISVTQAAQISIEEKVFDKEKKKDVFQAISSIPFMSKENLYISLKNKSLSHKGAVEVLEWKNKKMGSYTLETEALDVAKVDTLKLGGVNSLFDKYSAKVGDTIYFRYRLDNSVLKDTVVAKVAIIPQSMDKEKSVILGNKDIKSYNFSTGKTEELASNNDVLYSEFSSIKAVVESDITFVKVTSLNEKERNRLFSESDLTESKTLFDAGTPTNMAKFVSKGELYVYKVTRVVDKEENKTKVFYGLVIASSIADMGRSDEKLTLSYREGTF